MEKKKNRRNYVWALLKYTRKEKAGRTFGKNERIIIRVLFSNLADDR